MPTFNQLVRKGRKKTIYKSKSPALQRVYNSPEKELFGVELTSKERRMHNGKDYDSKET